MCNQARRVKKQLIIQATFLLCYYCKKPLYNEVITVDHKLPKSRGGKNNVDNLALCCERCNKEKADMTEDEYYTYLYFKETNPSRYELISISDIKVSDLFANSGVTPAKITKAVKIYQVKGSFDKDIILDNRIRKTIIDGYSRYLAAKILGLKYVLVLYNR